MSNLIRDILGLRDPLALLPTHPEVVKSRSSPWNWRFELQNVKIRSQLLREHKFAAFGTVTCSTVMADCKIYFDQNFYRRQPLCSLAEPKRSSLGRTMQCPLTSHLVNLPKNHLCKVPLIFNKKTTHIWIRLS